MLLSIDVNKPDTAPVFRSDSSSRIRATRPRRSISLRTKGRTYEAHCAIAADLRGGRSSPGGLLCFWSELAGYHPNSSEDPVVDDSKSKWHHFQDSSGNGVNCTDEHGVASIDDALPCHDFAKTDTTGRHSSKQRAYGHRSARSSPADHRSAGHSTPRYVPTDHGATADDHDNEPRRRRGRSRVLIVRTRPPMAGPMGCRRCPAKAK